MPPSHHFLATGGAEAQDPAVPVAGADDGGVARGGLRPAVYPAVTVDVVLLTVHDGRLDVLLVRRDHGPFAGMWAIPGNFLEPGESLEDAARRGLAAYAGGPDVYLEQLYTFGDPLRDPRGRVITVVYYALIRAADLRPVERELGGDRTRWFPLYDLPEMAFDHRQILDYTRQRLRGKLEYTTIGFQLLPAEFTLSQLQEVYEAMLDRRLDKRNFRKKIQSTGIVQRTPRTHTSGQHRPAQLFRFNPDAEA